MERLTNQTRITPEKAAWMERRAEQFPPAAAKASKVVGGGPIGAGKVKGEK